MRQAAELLLSHLAHWLIIAGCILIVVECIAPLVERHASPEQDQTQNALPDAQAKKIVINPNRLFN